MPNSEFNALETLRSKIVPKGTATPAPELVKLYEQALKSLLTSCRSMQFFLDYYDNSDLDLEIEFLTQVQNVFIENFPNDKTSRAIIKKANVAHTVFKPKFEVHKSVMKIVNPSVLRALNQDGNREKIKAQLEARLGKLKLSPSSKEGYLSIFVEKTNKGNQMRAATEALELIEKGGSSNLEPSQHIENELFLAAYQEPGEAISKLIDKSARNTSLDSAEKEVIKQQLEAIQFGLPGEVWIKNAINMDKVDPDDNLTKMLTIRVEEWNDSKAQAQIGKDRLTNQVAWLEAFKVQLVDSLKRIVGTVYSGTVAEKEDLDYHSFIGGSVVLNDLESALDKDALWDTYSLVLNEAVNAKLATVESTSPMEFLSKVNADSFRQSIDLKTAFEEGLKEIKINLKGTRERLTAQEVEGGLLEENWIKDLVRDITWEELLPLEGSTNVSSDLSEAVNPILLKKYDVKAFQEICSNDLNSSNEFYKRYGNFVHDFITPLVGVGITNSQIGAFDSAWIGVWVKHFESEGIGPLIEKYVSFSTTEQQNKLEEYTDKVIDILNDEYGISYQVVPVIAEIFTKKWMEATGAKLDFSRKLNMGESGFSTTNELVQFSGLLYELRDGFNSVNPVDTGGLAGTFAKVEETNEAFLKFTEACDVGFTMVGAALDGGKAFFETTTYRKKRGANHSTFLEAIKKLPLLGAVAIYIDEVRESKKTAAVYKEMSIKYDRELAALEAFDQLTEEQEIEKSTLMVHIERYTYAASKMYRRFVKKFIDFVTKTLAYVSYVMALMPTGVTQIFAMALTAGNALVKALQAIYATKQWFKKRKKKGTGKGLGEEREAVAERIVNDVFEYGGDDLDEIMTKDSINLMWRAGVYKDQKIKKALQWFLLPPYDDPSKTEKRALKNEKNLTERLRDIIAQKEEDTAKYLRIRLQLRNFMKESLSTK